MTGLREFIDGSMLSLTSVWQPFISLLKPKKGQDGVDLWGGSEVSTRNNLGRE
jgi:hypothetical protein